MLVKSQVKYIQSLGHKKFRDTEGAFVAEGPKIVEEMLLDSHLGLLHCFATASWLVRAKHLLTGRETRFYQVEENELERISFHSNPNQVLAVFQKPKFTEKTGGLVLLLDTIQDPGNLGTIVRTADWFGLNRVVCSEDSADVFNPKSVQSAMGSLIRVEVKYTDLERYVLAHPAIPLYAASLEGENMNEKLLLSSAMLLMGNESKGIRPDLESKAYKRIRIPGKGKAESLNVAVATGILLSRIETVS